MIMVETCKDQQEWDDYILDNGGHPFQLWGWGEVKVAHGWKAERLVARNGESIVAAVQVMIRPLGILFHSFGYISRGPVGDVAHFPALLDEAARVLKENYKSVSLTVENNSREMLVLRKFRPTSVSILSRETIMLNLSNSTDDIQAQMAKKTRQYIRKSASDGVKIRKVSSESDINTCLKIYRETAVRAGFNIHDEMYYHDVADKMGEHSVVYAAEYEGEIVAFLWLGVTAATAYELYGGVSEVGQRLRANYSLKWHAIETMKRYGVEEYDFGGMISGGVSLFKQGWSKEIYIFADTVDRPLSPLYPLWVKVLPKAKMLLQYLRRIRSGSKPSLS